MSDKKISDLVELTTLAADDVLPVVDASANATKRITGANVSQFPAKVITPSVEVADGGTIGSASDADAITIDATGNVALSQALQLGDGTAISSLGADIYRLTADATSNGRLTAWDRVDEATSETLGSGVTVSNGFFTLPNAGIWLIMLSVNATTRGDLGDSGADVTLEIAGSTTARLFPVASNDFMTSHSFGMAMQSLDSSSSIHVDADSLTTSSVKGNSNNTETHIAFVRLGDA